MRCNPNWGFIKRTVDDNFPSLSGVSREDKDHTRMRKVVSRALEQHDKLEEGVLAGRGKKIRLEGGGRKPIQPEVGTALFK